MAFFHTIFIEMDDIIVPVPVDRRLEDHVLKGAARPDYVLETIDHYLVSAGPSLRTIRVGTVGARFRACLVARL